MASSSFFKNKLVLVTGGSSGIGRQIAADFLRSGAQVIIVSDNPDHLAHAIEELSSISSRIAAVECNVADRNSVLHMKEQVLAQFGCPDILLNNAGYATYQTIAETDLEELERLISVNFTGAVRCTRVFLPYMIERHGGIIANMASIAGRIAITPNATYSAAKHALVAWSENLRYEVARFNVQVNVICPGRVEEGTSFFDHETFRTRTARLETRYTTTLQDISRATMQAIASNRFMTYIPWTLGLLVWLTNTFPFIVKPIYGRLLLGRIESIYSH